MSEQAERWITFAQEDLRMAEIALQEGIFDVGWQPDLYRMTGR
jgi:HEPN domain-containing protein